MRAAAGNLPVRLPAPVVTKQRTVLKIGAEVLETLPPGTELTGHEMKGKWLGVTYQRDGQELVGWVLPETVAVQRITLRTSTREISRTAEGIDWTTAVTREDGRRLAYVVHQDDWYQVVCNGQRGGRFDAIEAGQPLLSQDGRHLVYGARRDGQWYVVEDDTVHGPFTSLAADTPRMNDLGSLVVFAATRDGQQQVVAKGRVVGQYSELLSGTPRLSPDGEHYAFAARDDGPWRVVLDGREIATLDGIESDDLVFGSRGGQLACVGRRGNTAVAMLNGQIIRRHQDARLPYMHPDTDELCYLACHDNRWCVVFGALRSEYYDDIGDYIIRSHPTRATFWARTGEQWQVVHPGHSGSSFTGYGPGSLILSEDETQVAYVGTRAGKAYVVVGDKEYGPYEGVLAGTPVLDAQGKNVAYVALDSGVWRMYFNDRQLALTGTSPWSSPFA